MSVTTRSLLKEYCLRNLGAPVIEINVDDDQLEDRIDEALDYWRLYHYEGIEKVYLKQKINASQINLTTAVGSTFANSTTITGETSGATAVVTTQQGRDPGDSAILVRRITGTFEDGETITNGTATAVIDTDGVTLGEVDNKYIELTDWVYGVSRVLPFAGTQSSKSMFDIQYQLRLNDLYDLASTSIIYYKMVMGHLSLLDLELNGKPMFRFNRLQNRIYLDINWESDITLGDYVVVECYRALNPSDFSRVWSEPWLKHYVTALFKRQWGTNLKKFGGIQLPGGVTLDGQSMYDEAQTEIKALEDDLQTKSAPLEFFMG